MHRVAAAFARLVPRHVRFHPQRETEAMKVVFHAVANFVAYVIHGPECLWGDFTDGNSFYENISSVDCIVIRGRYYA